MTRPQTASPCILVCQLDSKTGWCLGCARSGNEIMEWPGATEPRKREIVDALPARLAQMGLPPGGDAQAAEARATEQRLQPTIPPGQAGSSSGSVKTS